MRHKDWMSARRWNGEDESYDFERVSNAPFTRFESRIPGFLSVSLLIPYLFSNYCGEWKPTPTLSILLITPKKR